MKDILTRMLSLIEILAKETPVSHISPDEIILELNRLQSAVDNLPDEKPVSSRFIVPSVDEVKEYMESQGILNAAENAKKFWHHYDARGWLIGKTKMKNWKSAVSTWELPRLGPHKKQSNVVG